MKRILLATDFSDSCQNALEYAMSLTSGTDIAIDLIHVFDIPVHTLASITNRAVQGMIDERKEATTKQLKEIQETLPEAQRGMILPVYGVYPSSDIADAATKIGADLIIMALRQKYSFVDRLMGTITAHTIQQSNTPVLAIPSGCKYREIQNILFPTEMSAGEDISETEESALEWLLDCCQMMKSPTIHMIHVGPENANLDITYKNLPFADMNFIQTHSKDIDEGIMNYLNNHEIDLLAFYKPNRPFWSRLYHSSLTRKLLFKSRLPLLIFS